ncbi:hypothetical protein SDC9_122486 [bioreactor metagenome]|uniref:Uncharacterized protein n=1 Tax=bioreactor metagenome TaxID=1076179 RepID=A0A645CF20_9ZZZZ
MNRITGSKAGRYLLVCSIGSYDQLVVIEILADVICNLRQAPEVFLEHQVWFLNVIEQAVGRILDVIELCQRR